MKKSNKIIYWIATIWLATGMLSSAVIQLTNGNAGPGGADKITHLGYPIYFLTILGIWKLLGDIAILIPKYPLVKEWAYAGFFFAMSGAVYSHVVAGDAFKEIFPSVLLLLLTLVSWYFRPVSRKPVSVSIK